MVVDQNLHWEELMKRQAQLQSDGDDSNILVGRSTFAIGGVPDSGRAEMEMMSRVLHGGSLNLLAYDIMIEEQGYIDSAVEAIEKHAHFEPDGWASKTLRKFVKGAVSCVDKIADFASEAVHNGIRVNIFDAVEEESIEDHFDYFESRGIQAGVVYTSSEEAVVQLSLLEDLVEPHGVRENKKMDNHPSQR